MTYPSTAAIMRNAIILATTVILLGATACVEAQQGGSAGQQDTISVDLSPNEFVDAIALGNALLIDVRTPGEHGAGHIEGNRNVDWTGSGFGTAFASLDPDQPLLLYCRSGGRSGQAMHYLQSKGFKNVRHLEGGFEAWKGAGLPVTN